VVRDPFGNILVIIVDLPKDASPAAGASDATGSPA
jgi:hypothetical protein